MRWLRSQVAAVWATPAWPPPAPADGVGGQQPDVRAFAPGGEHFRQPDGTTCGSSALVMAKMINTARYAEVILAPEADGGIDVVAVARRFSEAVLAMHRTTGRFRDSGGAWQLPWPARLGTPPWAVARQLSVEGGCGRPGRTYRASLVVPTALARAFDAVTAAVDTGESVPLFIGDHVMARHVVLVTGHTDDALRIYDPSCGEWVPAARDAWIGGGVQLAGWNQPWFVISPA